MLKKASTFALFFALVFSWAPLQAQERDKPIDIQVISPASGQFELWLMPLRIREATVIITGHMENMILSKNLPCTFDLSVEKQSLHKPFNLLSGQKNNAARGRWHYDWRYDWRIGVRGGRHNDKFIYRLPYQPGTSHGVAQGYGGAQSHIVGSETENSIDFVMPVGTTIYAARGGQVIATRVDSTVGGADPKLYMGCANYVVIKHDDGTYGSYEHLRQNGSLVQTGQMIQQGQPIAYSGLTGFTNGPHLHFQVYVPLDGNLIKSIPVQFRTATGITSNLQKGQIYENPLN